MSQRYIVTAKVRLIVDAYITVDAKSRTEARQQVRDFSELDLMERKPTFHIVNGRALTLDATDIEMAFDKIEAVVAAVPEGE